MYKCITFYKCFLLIISNVSLMYFSMIMDHPLRLMKESQKRSSVSVILTGAISTLIPTLTMSPGLTRYIVIRSLNIIFVLLVKLNRPLALSSLLQLLGSWWQKFERKQFLIYNELHFYLNFVYIQCHLSAARTYSLHYILRRTNLFREILISFSIYNVQEIRYTKTEDCWF